VVVTDDGAGSARPAVDGDADSGHGLVGMRERVALHGGELRTGSVGGGFEVRAWFPVGARPVTVDR
jgi:signal transduction histidine kinase